MRRLLVLFTLISLLGLAAAGATAGPPPASPDMTPSPTKVVFPRTLVGDFPSNVTITITNNSSYTWYYGGVSFTNVEWNRFDGGTCNSENGIAASSTCTVQFSVSNTPKGRVSGTFTVDWYRNDGLSTFDTHSYVPYSGNFYQPKGTF